MLRTYVGDVDSYTERVPVILEGHAKGNTFSHELAQNFHGVLRF